MAWTREQIERHTRDLPEAPGVYLMKDWDGRVLYVGKAVHLKNRVSSYFHRSGDPRPFVRLLSGVLDRVEVVVTSNEKEALILENELIKKHRPPFNILLRDDKNYLYLRLDPREPFPRLDLVRRRRPDGATYFGPYHTASSVRGTHALVHRYFGLRTCRDTQFRNRSRPCLEHQMGRCLGPCALGVPAEAYRERVEAALMFLRGRHEEVVRELEQRMLRAAEVENFEEAARLRDQVRAVRAALTRQSVVLPIREDVDAVGLARDGDTAAFAVLRFEAGVLLDRIPYVLEGVVAPDDDLTDSFLVQYYSRAPVPDRVLLPRGLVLGVKALSEVLGTRGARRVRVMEPARGPLRDAVRMATENARQLLRERLASSQAVGRALQAVADLLGLPRPPRRIEAYDMSQIQGAEPVGSLVVFTDGRPDRKAYRTYAVRGEAGAGDAGAMREVLARRFTRALAEGEMPDLVLLDGGPAQLSVVSSVLDDLGWRDLPLVALAKSRVVGRGYGTALHSPERLYMRGAPAGVREGGTATEAVLLVPPQNDPGLHLLMRVRDEAHRFAVSYHRKRRSRRAHASVLDGIPGLGRKRRVALLRRFGSVSALQAASLEDLRRVPGLPDPVARAIFERLHG